MNHQEYKRKRVMDLMHEIETKRNRYHRKENFECAFPELTEKIWAVLDSKQEQKLSYLIEELNKLSDTF